jgi:hypothetical protein
MTRFRKTLVAMAMLFATAGIAGVAAPAHAGGAGIQGCGASYAQVYPYTGPPGSYNCSGIYYMNVPNSPKFVSNGWSGYIVVGGVTVYFCDWETYNFSPPQTVTKLYLSATVAPWC